MICFAKFTSFGYQRTNELWLFGFSYFENFGYKFDNCDWASKNEPCDTPNHKMKPLTCCLLNYAFAVVVSMQWYN